MAVTKNSKRLFIVVLLLGWACDLLFWGKTVGINFTIFTSLCLIGGFYLHRADRLRPAPNSLWLLLPFVFFVVITFVRQEPLTIFLAYTFTIFSMGLLAVTYLGGRWIQYSLADYFKGFILLASSMFTRPLGYLGQLRKERDKLSKASKLLPIRSVLRGFLIAIPIVVFFASLLASADLIFSQKLIEFLELFSFGKALEYILRLVMILFYAYLLAGIFLHSASQSKDEELLGEDKPIIKSFLGFTEAAIVLGSVGLLFLLFVIVQFRYFFGGELNIGFEGYTYSQYARRGFNELVMVAFLSLLMILGLSTITKRVSAIQRRAFSGLSVAIVALVTVILVSAYQRLTLAILWHGYSRLRLYPRVFLIWVGILFVVVVVLELIHRERYFAFTAVLASIGFAISLSLLNVDASIVRHNVFRASQGRHFNVTHLASLSLDAVPALADEFLNSSLSVTTREGIGAALLCYHNSISSYPSEDWRSFNFSRWKADVALLEVQAQLDGYRVNDNKWPVRVRTPNDILYRCQD